MSKRSIAFAVAVAGAVVVAFLSWPNSSEDGAADKVSDDSSPLGVLRAKRAATGTAAAKPSTISGRVLTLDGAPVAGATVHAAHTDANPFSTGPSQEPIAVITDAQGAFRLDGLSMGRYRVSAVADGFRAGATDEFLLQSGEDKDDAIVVLEPGGIALTGRVDDVGGGPIPGALLQVTELSPDSPALAVLCNDNGEFSMNLAPGRYRVVASHPEYVEGREWVSLDDSPRQLIVKLVPAGSVTGRVITRDGRPVPDATVMARGGLSAGGGPFAMSQGPSTQTADDGTFELRGLEPGTFALTASARGVASAEPTEVELGIAESVTDVTVYVDKAYTLSGFVVKASDPTVGIAGVNTGAFTMATSAMMNSRTPTGGDGYFEIHGVRPGSYIMFAAGENVVPSFMKTFATVSDRDVDDVVLELEIGVTLGGRVTPGAAAKVWLELAGDTMDFSTVTKGLEIYSVLTQSKPDGTFEIRNVPRGKFKVRARAADGRDGTTPVEVDTRDLNDVVVLLKARGRVAGTVVDGDNRPVDGVTVKVSRPNKRVSFSLGAPRLESVTNTRGEFSIGALEPGKYAFTVEDKRGQRAWLDPNDEPTAEITAAESRTGIRLQVESANGVISGRVVGHGGTPIRDAWVVASREVVTEATEAQGDDTHITRNVSLEQEKPVPTDHEGRFSIANLRAGQYKLVATAPKGNARGEIGPVKIGKRVTIRLQPYLALSGTVTHQGSPVSSYQVRLFTADQTSGDSLRTRQVNSESGTFQLTRLVPGDYQVAVTAEVGQGDARVTLGERDGNVQVALSPHCSLRGKVLDALTDKPLGGFSVAARAPLDSGEALMHAVMGDAPETNSDGGFTLDKLACAKVDVVAFKGGGLFGGSGSQAFGKADLSEGGENVVTLYAAETKSPSNNPKATLGMTLDAATWATGPRAETEPPPGVDTTEDLLWVKDVVSGGAAEEAGARAGDQIVVVNNYEVAKIGAKVAGQFTADEMLEPKDVVTLTVLRGDERVELSITARAISSD